MVIVSTFELVEIGHVASPLIYCKTAPNFHSRAGHRPGGGFYLQLLAPLKEFGVEQEPFEGVPGSSLYNKLSGLP